MRYDMQQLTDNLKQLNFKPSNFIEIGSRDGHDTNYVRQYWQLEPANCYIIEAHPDCYASIKQQYPQYNTLNVAASNKTEPTIFNAGIVGQESNIGVSSILTRTRDAFISRPVEVDAWRLQDIMSHFNISSFDFMKIDVEGFGLEVLQGFGEAIKKTYYIQIELEVEEVWEGQSYYDDVVSYLADYGFDIIQDVDLGGVQRDVLFKNKLI